MTIVEISQWTPTFESELEDWLPYRTLLTSGYIFYSRKNDGTASNDGSATIAYVGVDFPGPPTYESFTRSTDMDNNVIWHASADA